VDNGEVAKLMLFSKEEVFIVNMKRALRQRFVVLDESNGGDVVLMEDSVTKGETKLKEKFVNSNHERDTDSTSDKFRFSGGCGHQPLLSCFAEDRGITDLDA
jgi:hypothetical protein